VTTQEAYGTRPLTLAVFANPRARGRVEAVHQQAGYFASVGDCCDAVRYYNGNVGLAIDRDYMMDNERYMGVWIGAGVFVLFV